MVGHVTFKPSPPKTVDEAYIRKALKLSDQKKIILLSGTTQPVETDLTFFARLLEVMPIDRDEYAIVLSLHPGRQDQVDFLSRLYKAFPCPLTQTVRIILPESIQHVPGANLRCLPFVYSTLRCGDLEPIASAYAQAVPGALINKGALQGVPTLIGPSPMNPYLNGATNKDPHRLFQPVADAQDGSSETLPEGDVAENLWKCVLP